MQWNPNPIVILYIVFGIVFVFMTAESSLMLAGSLVVFIFYLLLNRPAMRNKVFNRMKPFMVYIPMMGGLYYLISFLLTDSSHLEILSNTIFSVVKLGLMVGVMSVYLEYSGIITTLDAFRSLWTKTRLPWKAMDNMFLYCELVLRFFPTMRTEWTSMINSRKALGLSNGNQKGKSYRLFIKYLPGIVIQSYRKSEDVADVMIRRGYGKQIPRGMAYPISMTVKDGLLFSVFTVLILGVNYLA